MGRTLAFGVAAATFAAQAAVAQLPTPGPIPSIPPGCDGSDKVLQLMHVQDVSHSYGGDLMNLIPDIPTFETSLANIFFGLEIAVTSFSDKGTLPVGDPNGDYCYREDRGFGSSSMVPVLEDLTVLSGRDWRESQFDAIKYGLKSESLGWERGSLIDGKQVMRVALLATDALPHLKGTFGSWPEEDPRGCEFSDYPSVSDINQLLEEKETYLIAVVTGDIINSWKDLLKDVPRARVLQTGEDVVEEIEKIICDLPPPPPPRGCGTSLPRYGSASESCEDVCGGWNCDDADTARIGTSMEDCNIALDMLFPDQTKVFQVELNLFPYAGGCNTKSLFGLRKTILRPDGSGCAAQTGTSTSWVQRVCCCSMEMQPQKNKLLEPQQPQKMVEA